MQDTDSIQQWGWMGSLVLACLFIGRSWIAKLNPWALAQKMAESLTGPVMDRRIAPLHMKLDRVCRVIDHMDGAEDAHAAVRAEDNKDRLNWD